jgi:diguanylate cyclase (GGDEF)-like protein
MPGMQQTPSEASRPLGTSARILVIDDDAITRTVLLRQLTQRGFEARGATSGAEGLEIIRTGWPQAVLCDYLMPGVDGLAVVRCLRADAATAELPVILLTALDEPEAIVDAFEQGADDYVTKPAHPDEVRVRLIRLLRQAERRAHLAEAASHDTLTSLHNRRGLEESVAALLRQAQQQRAVFACVLFDLDHFKRINDQHGHAVGDQVLAETARRIADCLRARDVAARYGGEEFLVLLPTITAPDAVAVAERVRLRIEHEPFETSVGHVPITISGGVALFRPDDESWDALVARADAALYQAKQQGRNRIVLG